MGLEEAKMIEVDKLLAFVVEKNCSDLHLHVGRPPTVRMHGRLRTLETKTLTSEDTESLMKQITPERYQTELQERGSTDFGMDFQDKGRFRVAVFRQRGNVSLTLRLIPKRLMSLEELGLPPAVKTLLGQTRGLVLVTGPTGSGKTTTLAAMINYINENYDRHIITVEDPIEYYHEHKHSMVNQRALGIDVNSFAEAVTRSLRADPDVILVGEMRGLDTMEAAIVAAETGHLVFSTLHTNGAVGTVNRILDAFPNEQKDMIRVQLAESLSAIISQTLIPRIDIPGRVAAFEFLMVTPAARNMIRKNETFRLESVIQTGGKLGMQLLDDAIYSLWRKGVISVEESLERAQGRQDMMRKIGETSAGREALKQIRVAAPDETRINIGELQS